MKSNPPIIVGIGELLWDLLPEGKKAGGAPINFVYHANALGAEGYAISAVGQDDLGREIVDELEKNNIRYQAEALPYPTGHVLVELTNGIPSYTIVEDVAWDYIPLMPEAVDIVKKADAICFGTLALRSPVARAAIHALIDYAPSDTLRFFDINIRQHFYSKELIASLLQKANIFKINDEELALVRSLFGLEGNDEKVCRELIETYSLRYLVLTAGDKYSAVYTETDLSVLPTPKVDVVDTVGAGDAFSGAFVYSILSGKSLREAHRAAVDTAAFVCTQPGAWPPYSNK
ncbi:2-dehydro-3-deoxygluconokinase [Bacteroidia bacterium]|nr:2-dehydro-3-deoxygluconokinase [Bacteroidia bacterium]